jgi:hypothetical protein
MQSLTEPCQLPLVDVASEPAELLAPDKRTAPAILKALKGLFDQVSLNCPSSPPQTCACVRAQHTRHQPYAVRVATGHRVLDVKPR